MVCSCSARASARGRCFVGWASSVPNPAHHISEAGRSVYLRPRPARRPATAAAPVRRGASGIRTASLRPPCGRVRSFSPRLLIIGAFDAVFVRGKLGKGSSVPSVRRVGGTPWGFRFPSLLADAGRRLGVFAGGRIVPLALCYPWQHISLGVE
jgi:hypothetical protein